jgi:hypothetical protein
MESPHSEPRITTAHSQVTEKSSSHYIALSQTAQKALCPTVIPLLSDVFREQLPSDGSPVCYSGRVFVHLLHILVLPVFRILKIMILENRLSMAYIYLCDFLHLPVAITKSLQK